MKVFLSWSGSVSHRVAITLRDWLPSVLQYVDPYVSSEDIDKGARWSTDIARELEASAYGIIIVTPSNMEAPWISFESGALSKALDKSRVSPLLFGVKRAEVQGPLLQFQSTIVEKDDIKKLLVSINRSVGDDERLEAARLNKVFDVWWPELEQALGALDPQDEAETAGEPRAKVGETTLLEEILELVRSQQKILTSPDRLLPPDYLEYALARRGSESTPVMDPELRPALEYLDTHSEGLRALMSSLQDKKQPCFSSSEFDEFETEVDAMRQVTLASAPLPLAFPSGRIAYEVTCRS